jgi:Reverse transcriptase (RNA-dependent DNA polymerase)
LIPKVVEVITIKYFRPISLINYSFKIITKILANILANVMDKLIGETQTAFIRGRNMTDNIICAQITFYFVRKFKVKGILFKINLKKPLTPYFKCKKGLRQRDPLSLLFFNLVTDTLSKILHQVMSIGYIKDLGKFNNKCVSNLNFVNDILIFLDTDIKNHKSS